jgi:hypothetical protein
MSTGPEGAVSLEQAVLMSQAGSQGSDWAEDPQTAAMSAMQLSDTPAQDTPSYQEEPTDAVQEEAQPVSTEPTEEPVQDAPAQVQAEDEFNPVLLAAAGLTADEAKAQFKSPEALSNAVRLLDSRYIQAGTNYGVPGTGEPGSTDQQTPVDEDYQLPKPTESEDWTEDVKSLINSLQDHQKKQLSRRDQELQKQREQLESLMLQQSERERFAYVERLDAFVNSLGDEWTPILGKGSGFQLPTNGLAIQNRIHLDIIAGKLADGLSKHGRPELQPQDLYVRALHAAFPDQVVQTVRHDVTRQLESRQRQFTAKPTQKQGRGLSGVDQAIAHADDWYRTKGPIIDDGTDDI